MIAGQRSVPGHVLLEVRIWFTYSFLFTKFDRLCISCGVSPRVRILKYN